MLKLCWCVLVGEEGVDGCEDDARRRDDGFVRWRHDGGESSTASFKPGQRSAAGPRSAAWMDPVCSPVRIPAVLCWMTLVDARQVAPFAEGALPTQPTPLSIHRFGQTDAWSGSLTVGQFPLQRTLRLLQTTAHSCQPLGLGQASPLWGGQPLVQPCYLNPPTYRHAIHAILALAPTLTFLLPLLPFPPKSAAPSPACSAPTLLSRGLSRLLPPSSPLSVVRPRLTPPYTSS